MILTSNYIGMYCEARMFVWDMAAKSAHSVVVGLGFWPNKLPLHRLRRIYVLHSSTWCMLYCLYYDQLLSVRSYTW